MERWETVWAGVRPYVAYVVLGIAVAIALVVVQANTEGKIKREVKREVAQYSYENDIATWHDLLRGCARSNGRIVNANQRTAALRELKRAVGDFAARAVEARSQGSSVADRKAVRDYVGIRERVRALRIPQDSPIDCEEAYPEPKRPEGVHAVPIPPLPERATFISADGP